MNDFEGLLSNDYGFKPQEKSGPMAPPKPNNSSSNSNLGFDFEIGGAKTTPSSYDHDTIFGSNRKTLNDDFSDLGVFSTVAHSKSTGANSSSVNFDSIFGAGGGDSGSRFSSLPVFDRPVYDDEVSSSAKYEDIFSSTGAPSAKNGDAFDDFLGGLGQKEPMSARSDGPGSKGAEKGIPSFDDLLQGYGGSTSSTNRTSSDATKKTSRVIDDPFVVLESTSHPAPSSSGIFSDLLEEIGNLNNSGREHIESSTSGGVFDDLDPLDGLGKSAPTFSAEMNGIEKEANPFRTESRASEKQSSGSGDTGQTYSVRSPDRVSEKKMPMEDYRESPENVFDMPSVSADSHRSVPNASSPGYDNASFGESNSHGLASPVSHENMSSSDDIWLTVAEIPLFTQPTAALPPSRPPPPRPAQFSRTESGSFPASNSQKKGNEYSSYFQSLKSAPAGARGSFASPIDELEDFSMGRNNQSNVDGVTDVHVRSGEDFDTNSVAAASAAAMKEAMDRAEARFRHAKGARERENNAKASITRESVQVEKEEKTAQEREFRECQERLEREQQQRESEEEERRERAEEERRRIEKEREEKEREKRRMERERELTRQTVERAAREARERAAAEARSRAERAAVQKAQAEARERAGRAAVQRVQAEARERAAAEAKERAEKAAVEARERAREKEARDRAAAAAARTRQQKSDNDLESFFNSRASSVPRPRATSSDPLETQFQSKPTAEATRTSVNSSSSMRKTSSSANIVDDLSSIFGGPPSAGNFQEFEGETEVRRSARLDRHQRTQERAAKALAEKNARDLEAQREQAERHRIAETLDVEIKRWAAGKEGNLRALLSTMQYVLWPECGWQPVSLTDLITGASVKKVYRKATLCIHPDKVQQKGATLQQKYVAEKVFDLLKEAWNKFNSEELF